MNSRLKFRDLIAIGFAGYFMLLAAAGPTGADDKRLPEAPRSDHWAFQPVCRPALPTVHDQAWARTPLDAFVLARLEKEGLKPAPPADRRTLLRRVYLDLIGLPPTPEEQQAFLRDGSPEAYARVVDALLSRPQYGERWARHWFDVVRYAETNGYERDGAKPSAWRYRDYVIDAFNQDKPYDRFVTEQVAGDEIEDTSAEAQIATTFLRLGTWDDEPAEPLMDRYDQLDDVLGTTATAFLGVTLRCARCHDHKFEPFTQEDYYRMLTVFQPLKRPQEARKELDRAVGSNAELVDYRQAEAELARLQKRLDARKAAIRARLFAAPGTGQDSQHTALPPEAITAFQAEPGNRTGAQKDLVKKFAAQLEGEIFSAATPVEKVERERWEERIAVLKTTSSHGLAHAYIWYEEGPQAPATSLLRRGDPTRPGKVVEPGLPEVLVPRQPAAPKPLAYSTGRRLWLAQWLTRPDNPLVARVMVNRVWQHHFGRGLVASANDFGVMGDAPSHPELLDWLAATFVAEGWHLKALHRQIVLSSTYQMSSQADADVVQADPQAALLDRWKRRRLEAEAVRDSILAVSGQLNPQQAGPSVFPKLPRAVLEGQSRPGDGWGKSDERQAARRSVYIFVKRVLAVPELDLLDAPNSAESCEQRPVSTTAPQALTFLNGDFIQQQAGHFARRLEREAGSAAEAQLRRAFELALCRPARPDEIQAAASFLTVQQRQIELDARRAGRTASDARHQALAAFCLVLLNTNEFVYLN